MIPYIEIINKTSLKPFAIIEPSQCWFELSYYEVGEFQIYVAATRKNLAALQKGNYVKLPNKRFLWVIIDINYEYTADGARMISATGKEAKWLLHKRIIQTPLELPTSLANAIYKLVNENLGPGAASARIIQGLTVERSTLNITIDATQATRGNLLDFVLNILKNNNCGCQIIYSNTGLLFKMFRGNDLTSVVRFSQSLDNLLASSYKNSDANLGTYALIVSKVNEIEYPQEYNKNYTGVDRCEVLVNSNLATKYQDANGEDQELDLTNASDLATYSGWQVEECKNELTKHTTIEQVGGEIDLVNSNYVFDSDFYIGDIVGVQDEYYNFSINSRVIKYTISQDANGYAEAADYGE